MVAVALSASSFSGYMGVLAAFDVHAHGPHGMHTHVTHTHVTHTHAAYHDHGVVAEVGNVDDDQSQTSDEQGSGNHFCAHMHVNCCGAFGVSAADCGLKLAAIVRLPVPFADSHVPHGQIASPLFRPPRA